MATYKSEVLFQTYAGRLRPRSHYSLGRLPTLARMASRAPRLANRLLASPLASPGKRLAGVDGRRDLPRFASRTFREWFAEHPVADGDPVLMWVDTFTEHFTPEVGRAAVRLLEGAGFAVRVPDVRACCGLTLISTGQLDTARRTLRRSLDAIAPTLARGVPVVGVEPSCVAVFRGDAGHLLGADAHQVGGRVRTLAELLDARPGWAPPDLAGQTVVAQPHCHQHGVMGWGIDRRLLERAGATVRQVGGCCGLAGNFGAERGHYEVSVAVAETALLPAVRAMVEDEVLLADGFSCRTQLKHLSGRPGIHLAQLLSERPR